jgi:hypothetical protein
MLSANVGDHSPMLLKARSRRPAHLRSRGHYFAAERHIARRHAAVASRLHTTRLALSLARRYHRAMTQPDALFRTCRKLARMEDGPRKRGLQEVTLERLAEYEAQGHITADTRLMLEQIVMETSSSRRASNSKIDAGQR